LDAILTLRRTMTLFLKMHEIYRKSRGLNESFKKDVLVDPASNFQTSFIYQKSVQTLAK
jgi:hypothetical protein